ncbi:site-specific DNA-methyltransferase [Iamia majanohamensis]|uniref:Methyltransferase n=1 Tax=Iamia majanohamensis TaxID=467976 RepID=A0AAF0BUI3_9ACTN|nr:site-specific DNA-methyltransferase [Iamia majanohamensis]WCO65815.1 site-specific DNA-methyltransferase [Iamia majanohamensis]
MAARPRRPTATSAFGVGRRESHDATDFYARFTPPEVSADDTVVRHVPDEPLVHGDARDMRELKDGSVALVVTSPPYFAGKAYEVLDPTDPAGTADPHIPASYVEYVAMLRDVFAECVRVLEPGGRIAVNVANLGRKPYRSLSADVIRILQDDLGLLIRGEVVWVKARGAGGNCAWGTYREPANPVLRDVTERVIVAGKGRFDRAVPPVGRRAQGLPHASTLTGDEFLDATLDLWELPPESASRVDHPAPFPVALPQRLIELYTYADDLVVDPFLGSGTTAVAAVRTGRRYAGYDLDPAYVATARRRVEAEHSAVAARVADPATVAVHEARVRGTAMKRLAAEVLVEAGFTAVRENARVPGVGIVIPLTAEDQAGRLWLFDTAGGFTVAPSGLARTDVAMTAIGRGTVVAGVTGEPPVLLVPALPSTRSGIDRALRRAGPGSLFDVVEVLAPESRRRLAAYASGTVDAPLAGFWKADDLRP